MREQAGWCERLGSPLYESLFLQIAKDVESRGVCWQVLEPRAADPARMKLPLRFLAAVHRMVLEGELPELARYYPSAGGTADPDAAWEELRSALERHGDEVRARLPETVQTSETKRCCALLPGFLEVARRTGLPLRIVEIGSSAGLNLRWDHYRYEADGHAWGPRDSPLVFRGMYEGNPPTLDVETIVAERSGCDLNPINPLTDDGKLTLQSFLWPDQLDRFDRLQCAIEVARRVPARVDRTDGVSWIEKQLAEPRAGVATVVFHSIVLLYLSPEGRDRLLKILNRAGERATGSAPLAWLSMEPGEGEDNVRLAFWPGGERRAIARAGYHGGSVTVL